MPAGLFVGLAASVELVMTASVSTTAATDFRTDITAAALGCATGMVTMLTLHTAGFAELVQTDGRREGDDAGFLRVLATAVSPEGHVGYDDSGTNAASEH